MWEAESLDGAKFKELLIYSVIPAIRKKFKKRGKFPKVVGLQFDNAPGHMTGTIAKALSDSCMAPIRKGKVVGPLIVLVEQLAQSDSRRAPTRATSVFFAQLTAPCPSCANSRSPSSSSRLRLPWRSTQAKSWTGSST